MAINTAADKIQHHGRSISVHYVYFPSSMSFKCQCAAISAPFLRRPNVSPFQLRAAYHSLLAVLDRHPALWPEADHVPARLQSLVCSSSSFIVSRSSSASNTIGYGAPPPVSVSQSSVASISAAITAGYWCGRRGGGEAPRGPSTPHNRVRCTPPCSWRGGDGRSGDGRASLLGFVQVTQILL